MATAHFPPTGLNAQADAHQTEADLGLPPGLGQTAQELIAAYGLHTRPVGPVDLAPLLEGVEVRVVALPARIEGFALDMGDKLIVTLSESLAPARRRFVLAHEVGHLVLAHSTSLSLCGKGRWLHNRQEKEATALAAFLLLPAEAVAAGLFHPARGSRVEELAALYHVPAEIVLVRRALYAQFGL